MKWEWGLKSLQSVHVVLPVSSPNDKADVSHVESLSYCFGEGSLNSTHCLIRWISMITFNSRNVKTDV